MNNIVHFRPAASLEEQITALSRTNARLEGELERANANMRRACVRIEQARAAEEARVARLAETILRFLDGDAEVDEDTLLTMAEGAQAPVARPARLYAADLVAAIETRPDRFEADPLTFAYTGADAALDRDVAALIRHLCGIIAIIGPQEGAPSPAIVEGLRAAAVWHEEQAEGELERAASHADPHPISSALTRRLMHRASAAAFRAQAERAAAEAASPGDGVA